MQPLACLHILIMTLMKDILRYLTRPYFYLSDAQFSLRILPTLGKILALKLGLVLIAYFVTNLIFRSVGTDRPDRSSDLFDNYDIGLFIFVVLVAPFLEEAFFRSWLRVRGCIFYIFPLFLFLSILILSRFFGLEFQPIFIWITLLAYGLCVFIIHTKLSTGDADQLVQALFPFSFWSSAAFFALIHLTNYKAEEIGILGLMIVLPQFISGVLYGYVVMRFGFLSAFFCHAAWNGSLLTVALIAIKFGTSG